MERHCYHHLPYTAVGNAHLISCDHFLESNDFRRTAGSRVGRGEWALGMNLRDSLSSRNSAQSVSTIFNTTVGSVVTFTSTLTCDTGASGIAPFNLSASSLAENTAVFQFEPITPTAG